MKNRYYTKAELADLSILIPTIRPDDVASCLLSVALSNTLPENVIIYNNGKDILKQYQVKQYVALLRHMGVDVSITFEPEKRGIGYARKWLLSHTRNRLILFLDDDIVLLPDTISNLLEDFEKEPDAGWISPVVLMAENAVDAPNFIDSPMTYSEIMERGNALYDTTPFVWAWNLCSEPAPLYKGSKVATTCCLLVNIEYITQEILDKVGDWVGAGEDEVLTSSIDNGIYDFNTGCFHIASFEQERTWGIGTQGQDGERGWKTKD